MDRLAVGPEPLDHWRVQMPVLARRYAPQPTSAHGHRRWDERVAVSHCLPTARCGTRLWALWLAGIVALIPRSAPPAARVAARRLSPAAQRQARMHRAEVVQCADEVHSRMQHFFALHQMMRP